MNLVKKITLGLTEYQALLSILSIPIYALISRLVFWNYKQFNYLAVKNQEFIFNNFKGNAARLIQR